MKVPMQSLGVGADDGTRAPSITLRRNGRVVIKGTQVESHASGTHRIKGGSVKVN